MPIESKECFTDLTEDGQLWEIYQAVSTGGGGGSPTGPAGGDLTGTYPNPLVDGLQGVPISNAIPTNGQVLQYDGTNWVPGSIPSGGSGGGGVVYYLNFGTAADAPITNIPQTPNASKELGITAETTATSYQSAILSTANYDFLASFVTDLNVPSATAIPAGIWDFNIFAESTTTNSANQVYYKIEILKYDGVNAPTLLATSNNTYIYDPTEITQYVSSVVMPQTTILATDRIVVYLYGRAHQNNNRLTFRFGDGYPSHTHSTMPSVTGTGVVKVVNGVFQSPASTIVDSDVSATANIAQSKIANLTIDLTTLTNDIAGKVSKIGDTMFGKLNLSPSSTTTAGLNLGTGSSPTFPISGDMWATTTNLQMFLPARGIVTFPQLNASNAFTTTQSINATSGGSLLDVTNTQVIGGGSAATFTSSGTNPTVEITQNGNGGGLRITNASGTGDCLRIDDESPEFTPFVVSATGKVGIGANPDSTIDLQLGSTGVRFNNGTIQNTAAHWPIYSLQFDYSDYIYSSTSFIAFPRAIVGLPSCILNNQLANNFLGTVNIQIRLVLLQQYGGADVQYVLDAYSDGGAPVRLTPPGIRQRTTNGPNAASTETITTDWVQFTTFAESTTFQLLGRRTSAGSTMLLTAYMQVRPA